MSALRTVGVWIVCAAATGAESQVRELSLADCIQIAVEHNLDVQIARYEPEIAKHNLALAYTRYEPTFDFSTSHSFSSSPGGIDAQNRPFSPTETERDSFSAGLTGLLPTGLSYDLGGSVFETTGTSASGPFENASGSLSIELRQPLLRNFWIDSTRLSVRVGKNRVKASELQFRNQLMRLITSVEQAYYDLLLAHANIQAVKESLQLAERSVASSKRRVELKTLAPLDEKQAESQLSARQADLLSAQGALVAREYTLKQFLSDDFTQWENITIKPTENLVVIPRTFSREESWRVALTQRPDLLQAKLNLERQGLVLKFLRNQRHPQLDLVGSYGQAGSRRDFSGVASEIGRGDRPFYSVGTFLRIPIGNGAARHTLKIGRAEEQQLLLGLKQLEQDIMVEIGIAVDQARIQLARVDATRQTRRFAEAAMEGEQRKLDNGRTTAFVVLQLQRDLTAARLLELGALADYNKALAQLALREGATFERHRLDVNLQ